MEVPPLKKASIFGFGLLLGSWYNIDALIENQGEWQVGKGLSSGWC